MTQTAHRQNARVLARERYSDRKNVEDKWLDQFGNISFDGDYSQNQKCIQEVFNMVDVVMENKINEYIHTHSPVTTRREEYRTWYEFQDSTGRTFAFWYPQSFAARTNVLRQMEYPLSEKLDAVRKLRNETAHGNQTVVLQSRTLSYSETRKAMTVMADALILLGMLDVGLREPSFDRIRVQEGDTLQRGSYSVGKLAGEGGMSRVYEGIQKHTGRKVAIKELKPDTFSLDQFLHERDVLLRLHNDHIPHVYDLFFENGTYYMIMSFVEGITLEEYISRHNPLPMDFTLAVSRAILDILSYLHSPEVNLVFVDLSPDNILIDEENVPWLIDFGISGEIHNRQTVPAAKAGYSAPEVFEKGVLDERTDIYSFGYILRYLLTGYAPDEKVDVETAALTGEAEFSELINYCIAVNPEGRFQSIRALQNSFLRICGSRMPAEAVKKGKRIQKKHAVILLLLCILAGAAGVFRLVSRDGEESEISSGEDEVTGSLPAEDVEAEAVTEISDIPAAVSINCGPVVDYIPTEDDEERIREMSAKAVFSYNYEEKTLTIENPVDMWYAALVNWNDLNTRNLLLAVSSASDVPEAAAFSGSPCILNGDISRILLEYDDGTHSTFSFQVENGDLVSCSLERFGEESVTDYVYNDEKLIRFYTERDGREIVNCILQYDDADDLSTIAFNSQMFTVLCDSRGYVVSAKQRSETEYRFAYTDHEISRSVTDNVITDKTDRQYTINEDGTLAACQYQAHPESDVYDADDTAFVENIYSYESSE